MEGAVRIDDIIPYERNARKNDEAIPAVAESIKEFGLKGQIVLESMENPVIVAGHTRWAACKSLGWEEIPDERIDFCDGLTEDQIKAFRLADNKTARIAKWNKKLLWSEVKSIKSLDMSRFAFDFKSKDLPLGAERMRTDKYYNLHLVDIYECAGPEGYPTLEPCDTAPKDLIPFKFCKTATEFDVGVHFCLDDYQFERVWTSPEKYLDLLRKFDCVVTPDFSVYLDMPIPMKKWNIYRSRALGHWWQEQGLTVIPNVTWADKGSYGYCFEGIPRHATVFISTVGVQKDRAAREMCISGMRAALKEIEPSRVLLHGGDLGVDFGGIEVVRYSQKIFRASGDKKGE